MAESEAPAFLAGGGEMGSRVAALDWSATAVGPLEDWPTSLRSAVGLLLRSPVAMVLLWGEPGTMIYNDAYAGFAGARHPGQLGMPVREGWPEVADFNDHVMRTGLAGETLVFKDQELTLYRDGTPEQVWMDLYYSPVLGDDEKPAGVIAIVVETTAKVTADRWLRDEATRLREMFEHAPTFFALLEGPEHRFEFVNPAYQRLVGERLLVGLPVRQALPEVEGQGFFEIFDEVYATGNRHTGAAVPAMLSRGPGGAQEQRFVEFVIEPVRDSAGAMRAIMVHGSDVTERVLSEQALRESEARYRGFAQAMPNQVWTARPDGQLDWFNDRALAELDATYEELAGERWAARVHPDDIGLAAERWATSLRSGLPYETQFRLGREETGWRWHIARASAVRDTQGWNQPLGRHQHRHRRSEGGRGRSGPAERHAGRGGGGANRRARPDVAPLHRPDDRARRAAAHRRRQPGLGAAAGLAGAGTLRPLAARIPASAGPGRGAGRGGARAGGDFRPALRRSLPDRGRRLACAVLDRRGRRRLRAWRRPRHDGRARRAKGPGAKPGRAAAGAEDGDGGQAHGRRGA